MSTRSLTNDLRALGRRALAAVRAVPGWLGGILAGIQAAALSYLALLAPTLAVAAAAPADGVASTEWSGAMSAATQLWLLGHGTPADVAGVTISLVPLGLTILNGAILAAVSRRFAARTWGSWGLAVATYAASVGLIAATVSDPNASTGPAASIPTATVVAALLAAVSVAIGIWRAHGATLPWLTRIPEWVRAGVRRGAAAITVIVAVAGLTGATWAIVGRQQIADLATGLELDAVSAGVLAIAQTAYVPTLVVWMVAWLSGQGFAVGLGTAYAPDALATDALPHLPLLGALPSAAGDLLTWAPAVIVVAVLVIRLIITRHHLEWRMDLAADGIAAALVGVVAALAFVVTSGAIGPGRLETVGAAPLAATVAVLGLTAAGLGLAALVDRGMLALTGTAPTEPAPNPAAKTDPAGASAVFKG